MAESWARRLSAFTITADGGLSKPAGLGRLLARTCRTERRRTGYCVDAEGAVWYADVPNQTVRAGPRGRRRAGGSVSVDRGAFSCMLGGPDGRTLFVLAAEWAGFAGMDPAARTGQLLIGGGAAPAAHAGRP